MDTTEITAGRLHLRPWVLQDVDALVEACQDPLIPRFTSVPTPYARADAVEFVETVSQPGWEAGTAASFAVLDATGGELLGSVSLFSIVPRRRTAEVGYWTVSAARGRGITTEAVSVLCRWGFAELGLRRIVLMTDLDNATSQAVARKAGFAYEGIARGSLTSGQDQIDGWQSARLSTD